MKTGIYMIRNKINNKAYIGQAVDIDRRWSEHIWELNNNKHRNQYLQRAWNKYGADNFEFTIICLCEEEELNEFEIDMIAHFDTYNNGYNLTLGGDGVRGYKHTDERRAKVSERTKEAMKEYYKDPENRKKRSETMKEYYKDPENRKKRSEAVNRPEVKKKHRERTIEALNRPEVRAKMSEAKKGKPKSEEFKAKISEALKEYYKDPENRKKTSEAMKGKGVKAVYCATNDTIYASTVEAGERLNVDQGCISRCCNGKNINKRYPDGHHYKKGHKKDSPVYEFWFLDEYEEKFGKAVM